MAIGSRGNKRRGNTEKNGIINQQLYKYGIRHGSRHSADTSPLEEYCANFFTREDGTKVADLADPQEVAEQVQQGMIAHDKRVLARQQDVSPSSIKDYECPSYTAGMPNLLVLQAKEEKWRELSE